ncbi:Hypothetical predicted protein [Mytilus galloprovincialis]|uniref:NR LBD domain-containing protein n=1 Tax=Mytilus galloprovincialis TaxID=29158 RepID=A0A8B6CMQ0_MYTGA|nr:Hypothetical predicted protein [Mytilus galloprovincialis]
MEISDQYEYVFDDIEFNLYQQSNLKECTEENTRHVPTSIDHFPKAKSHKSYLPKEDESVHDMILNLVSTTFYDEMGIHVPESKGLVINETPLIDELSNSESESFLLLTNQMSSTDELSNSDSKSDQLVPKQSTTNNKITNSDENVGEMDTHQSSLINNFSENNSKCKVLVSNQNSTVSELKNCFEHSEEQHTFQSLVNDTILDVSSTISIQAQTYRNDITENNVTKTNELLLHRSLSEGLKNNQRRSEQFPKFKENLSDRKNRVKFNRSVLEGIHGLLDSAFKDELDEENRDSALKDEIITNTEVNFGMRSNQNVNRDQNVDSIGIFRESLGDHQNETSKITIDKVQITDGANENSGHRQNDIQKMRNITETVIDLDLYQDGCLNNITEEKLHQDTKRKSSRDVTINDTKRKLDDTKNATKRDDIIVIDENCSESHVEKGGLHDRVKNASQKGCINCSIEHVCVRNSVPKSSVSYRVENVSVKNSAQNCCCHDCVETCCVIDSCVADDPDNDKVKTSEHKRNSIIINLDNVKVGKHLAESAAESKHVLKLDNLLNEKNGTNVSRMKSNQIYNSQSLVNTTKRKYTDNVSSTTCENRANPKKANKDSCSLEKQKRKTINKEEGVYFENCDIYFVKIWKYDLSMKILTCGKFTCKQKSVFKELKIISHIILAGFQKAHKKFVERSETITKIENPEQITDGSLRNLYSEFTTNLVIFIVDFSNCIRTFVLLPDDFRKIQIKQCLLEMAVIYYTYWYSVRKSDIFWEIYNLDTSMKKFFIHGGEIGHLISSIFRSALSFKLLNLTDQEICLLAAMVLLSPGMFELSPRMFEPLNSFVNLEI